MGSLVPRLHREKKSLNLPCPTWPEYEAKLWGTAPIFHSVCDDSVYPVCHVSLSLSSDFGIAQIYGGLVMFLVSGFILDTDEKWWLQWFLRGLRWPAHD